jgi:outer membrane protein assembly factor BamB
MLWEKHLASPADLQDVNALAFNGTTLFAASYSGGVYALAPEDGTIRWRAPLTGVTRLKTDAGLVYAGAPGFWSGLRIGDGSASWSFKLPELIGSTDAVISDRFLVFAEEGGSMYFLDKRTGEPAGTLFSGEGFSSPPAAAGPIVAGLSNGGRVYTLTVVP